MLSEVGNITALKRRNTVFPQRTSPCDPSCHETPVGLHLTEIRRETPGSTVISPVEIFSGRDLALVSDSQGQDTDGRDHVIKNVRRILIHRLQNYPSTKSVSIVMEMFTSIFENFFELNEELKPQISDEELKVKLSFVEELITTIPNSVPIVNLEEEYRGYQIYKKSPFQKSADDFVSLMKEPLFNNYKTRGRVAKYLEMRSTVGDLARGKSFLKNLVILRTSFHVRGTETLLKLALANELSFGRSDHTDSAHGFYRHAYSALLLAENKKLRVEDLAVRKIKESGQTIEVPRLVGDIDIIARDENATYFIEVKSSVNSANGSLEQIESFVSFAQRYGAVPVLLLGNIETPDLNHLSVYRTLGKRNKVLKDVKDAIEIVNKFDGELRILNKSGDDITEKLMSYVKNPKPELTVA